MDGNFRYMQLRDEEYGSYSSDTDNYFGNTPGDADELQEDSIWNSEDPNCKQSSTILTPFILEVCEGRRLTEDIILEKISTQGQSKRLKLGFELISVIDNLRSFTFLSHLELNNNLIEKVSGLEALTNLIYLDLSFNKIRSIEGLTKLTKLENLFLFSNNIVHIRGLKYLKNLRELSLGMNCISNSAELDVLRLFVRLDILVLAGNPIAEWINYRKRISELIPSLTSLDDHRFNDPIEIKANDKRPKDEKQEQHCIRLLIPENILFLPKELSNLSSYQFFLEKDFENNDIFNNATEEQMKTYFKNITDALMILKELDDRCHCERQNIIEAFLGLVEGMIYIDKKQMAATVKKYIAERSKRFNAIKGNYSIKDFIVLIQRQSEEIDILENEMRKQEERLRFQVEKELRVLERELEDLILDYCDSLRLVFSDLMDAETEAVLLLSLLEGGAEDLQWREYRQRRVDLLNCRMDDLCACAATWRLEMVKSLVHFARAHEVTLDSRRFLKVERERMAQLCGYAFEK